MLPVSKRTASLTLLAAVLITICACGGSAVFGKLSYFSSPQAPLAHYQLTGDTLPVLDPSIIRQNSTWYAFSTDVAGFQGSGSLRIHCSEDKVEWRDCGEVFPDGIPAWVRAAVPGVEGLWAPDISFFNGEYHLYYNGSTLGSQRTVIGLATNVTLDPASPDYAWLDHGAVLASKPGDDFNALDPNILVDSGGSVWLTYGSYWSGIKQREIDPATGMLLASNPARYDLAARPAPTGHAIEGASLVHHGGYYYLFVSVDHCCESSLADDDYKQAVGRSESPHGPFSDEAGTPMLSGGGTVLIEGTSSWNAPGGGTAYLDPVTGESLLVFHAQNLAEGGTPYQWLKTISWPQDWPVVGD